MSCFTCIPVDESNMVVNKFEPAVTNQGTHKVVVLSTDSGAISKEEKEFIREGKVKLKSGSVIYSWKTTKVVVEERHLLAYEKKSEIPTILPLQLCNVRPVSSRRFRVFCAPNIHLEMRAKDNQSMRDWVTLIQEGVVRQLSAQTEDTKTNSGMELLDALRDAHEANRVCADCNAPDPKWISVSIGCIVCIECSGVHRHLGVTISKVRSFELDMWNEKTEVTEKIGNADINTIYEANIIPGHKKPHADSDREDREKFIYNKYVCKLYKRKSSVVRPILNTQTKKKNSSVQLLPPNEKLPTHKRNPSQKPPIHIGSNMFSPQLTRIPNVKFDPHRRASVIAVFDTTRRGSLGSVLVSKGRDQHDRRFSLAPSLVPSQ